MWFYCETKEEASGIITGMIPVFVDGPPKASEPHQAHMMYELLVQGGWEEVSLRGIGGLNKQYITKRFVKTPVGIFPHKCVENDCDSIVRFDDEPWCFTHSPDEGSSFEGYSARKNGLS